MSLTAEKKEKKPKRKRPTTYGKKYRKKKKPTEVKMEYANKLETLRSISDSDDEEFFTPEGWEVGRAKHDEKVHYSQVGRSFNDLKDMEIGALNLREPKTYIIGGELRHDDLDEGERKDLKDNYKVIRNRRKPGVKKRDKSNKRATLKMYKGKKRDEGSDSSGVGSSGRKPSKVKLYKNKKKVTTYQPGKKLPKDLFSAVK